MNISKKLLVVALSCSTLSLGAAYALNENENAFPSFTDQRLTDGFRYSNDADLGDPYSLVTAPTIHLTENDISWNSMNQVASNDRESIDPSGSFYPSSSASSDQGGLYLMSDSESMNEDATEFNNSYEIGNDSNQSNASSADEDLISLLPDSSESFAPAFSQLDTDNGGYLTKNEVKDLNGFRFSGCDQDQNNRLNEDEFQACWNAWLDNENADTRLSLLEK